MISCGLGPGLTSVPATELITGATWRRKAGVAATGAPLAVLFPLAQPMPPAQLTRPAQPADKPTRAAARAAAAAAAG
jgi:hypothetical protein